MPNKPRYGSRRKTNTPRRVVRVQEDLNENDRNVITLPKDPAVLAAYISERLTSEFFELPTTPEAYFQTISEATAKAGPGEQPLFKCCACKEKSYRSVPGLQYHLMHNCPDVPEQVFTCVICRKEMSNHDEIEEHIQEVHVYPYLDAPASDAASRRAAHSSRLKIQMFAESSSAAEELEKTSSSMSDFDEDEVKPSKEVSPPSPSKETRKRPKPSYQPGGYNHSYTSVDKPLARAYKWTLNERLESEKKFPLILPDIHPPLSSWTRIEDSSYLHTIYKLDKNSPSFAIDCESLNNERRGKAKGEKKKKASTQTPKKSTSKNNSLTYQKLKLFQSLETNSMEKITFYAGGPVWSMDWCPCPTSDRSLNDQYLALSTHREDHLVTPDALYFEPGVVQLWNCGKLPLQPLKEDKVCPYLSYAIALNVGPVWDMEWSPLAESILNLTSKCERLGLLGLACASGVVNIFAMPKPSSLLSESNRSGCSHPLGRGEIYKAKPSYILKALRKNTFGQCLCLSWSRENGCCFIAAGFASGHIAFWDLTLKSPLLFSEENGVRTLYAYHTFRSHSKSVKSVAWCPFDSNILISGGADRLLKVWDQRNTDTDIPHCLPQKMSIISELKWPVLWCGVYAASDCVFSIPYFHGCLHLNVGTTTNPLQSIAPLKSASWTVTSCDWLNAVATGDVDGSAMISICNNWNRSYISNKRYARVLIFQTDIEWIDQKEASGFLEKASYEVENDSYKLVFHDCDLTKSLTKWQALEAHARIRTFEDFRDESYDFPAGAVHKMRWNPNLSSFTWIASATYSGLVRLQCLSGLISDDVENVFAETSPT